MSENLDESTNDESLKALFEPFGTVSSVNTPLDAAGKSKDRFQNFALFDSVTCSGATPGITALKLGDHVLESVRLRDGLKH